MRAEPVPLPSLQSIPETSFLREKELWLLILAGVLFFFEPLFAGRTFFFRDLYLHFYPQKVRFIELLTTGKSLLWDPYLHGGQPFLANPNNLVLYPTNILYLILPTWRAFNIDIVLHVLLSAAAAYWLARMFHLQPFSSLLAGGIYGYCGFALSLTNFMNRLFAMPYLPLMLLFWHQFLQHKKKKSFVMTVVSGSIQVLAGAPEMSAISLLFLLGWAFAFTGLNLTRARIFVCWLLLVLFICGITALQLVPAFELIANSARAGATDFWFSAGWPLHPKRIPELLFPGFFGETHRLNDSAYWGRNIEDLRFPYILSIYFGFVPLALAFAAVFEQTGTGQVPRKVRIFLFAVLILSVGLSLGRFLPFFEFLQRNVPLFSLFRYSIKFLAAAILPVALLAACAMDAWLRRSNTHRALPLCFLFFSVITGALVWISHSPSGLTSLYFGEISQSQLQGLQNSFLHAGAVSLLACCILYYRQLKPRWWHGLALPMLIMLDLFWAGRFAVHFAPHEFFTKTPASVKMVRDNLQNGRLYRGLTPRQITYFIPADDRVYLDRWQLETLYNYTGALYSIPVIYHEDYDRLAPRWAVRLSNYVYRQTWQERLPLLSIGRVTVILSAQQLAYPQLEPRGLLRNSSNVPFYVYRNRNALKRAEFVSHAKYAASEQEAIDIMTNPLFDPHKQLVLLQKPDTPDGCNPTSITIQEIHENQYKITSQCSGYLIFSDTFYPGWKVNVDGKRATLLRANVAFSAVHVASGSHYVTRRFVPLSFFVGAAISVVALLFLVILPPRFLN